MPKKVTSKKSAAKPANKEAPAAKPKAPKKPASSRSTETPTKPAGAGKSLPASPSEPLAKVDRPCDCGMFEPEADDVTCRQCGGRRPKPAEPAPKASGLASRLAAGAPGGWNAAPHLIVEARAGTGKTTTLVEGLKELVGIGSELTPSPQQRAVWDSICLSRGKVKSIGFVAFNKAIAKELQDRLQGVPGCSAMTMHSMGVKAVRRSFELLEGDNGVQKGRVQNIICELTGSDIWYLRKNRAEYLSGIEELVSLCKQNLVAAPDDDALDELARQYGLDLNGSKGAIYDIVPDVLDRCKDVNRDRYIDFNDMIWLPVVLGLSLWKYDLLLVDEAQDLNRCQQALAKMAGNRLILCGDPRQAIYGFAGADSESMPRMLKELGRIVDVNGRSLPNSKCDLLPLTVTRRCGKAIVAEAKKLVPDFEAHESNGPGAIIQASYNKAPNYKAMEDNSRVAAGLEPLSTDDSPPTGPQAYLDMVEDGDMIICRCTAPLVSQCFRLLKQGRKANILGRDIGAGIIATLKKMKATTVPELITKLSDWCHAETSKELAKRFPSDNKIIAIQDKHDCLVAFCEGVDTLEGVEKRVNDVFTDDSKDRRGIRLATIHKSKGLEERRVFFIIIDGAMCPHPMAKTPQAREQELNLKYVGITRAIQELVYVT